ncbi:Pycsar system effector family protein [Streptacidiphilus jiangxiensis]|uniref:Pycsar effector protein domain-containing protein n=1 Tax=Streptacidiphilus jiangxiensis TaxID=235985 RepID=A0A1H7J2K0_STRJI|nr:Pycsar system effector family protein [Streptacidiphilus jiangxiensis]SEK68939.1 hypothetical protein SAMN05414137_103124 [Streptacidiphilus jiangxiensis]
MASGSSDPFETLTRTLVAETRTEMAKADQKAGVILSALVAALAALVATAGAGGVTPAAFGAFASALFWFGCSAWVPALVMLGLAVAPRPGLSVNGRAHYFADVASILSAQELGEILRGTDAGERDLSQLLILSQIAVLKYRLIRWGMLASAVFVISTFLGLLLGVAGHGSGF